MDLGWVIALAIQAIGGLVWAVRQEGRVNVLQAKHDGLRERVDGLEDRIVLALERIERKLDQKADK